MSSGQMFATKNCCAAAHTATALTAADRAADLARTCYAAGCTVEQVRGCVRHLIVCVRAPHGLHGPHARMQGYWRLVLWCTLP